MQKAEGEVEKLELGKLKAETAEVQSPRSKVAARKAEGGRGNGREF